MPVSHAVRYAALTDVGVKRSHNQDAFATHPATDEPHWHELGHVYVVADGMGGHAVGEKASAKAVRDIPLVFLKHVAKEGAPAAIRRAFREANHAIFTIGTNNPEFKGLGTTGTGLFIRPEGAWLGHVGDSRAYRVRGNRIHQLTFDHSWVWEVAKRQGIDPDELGDFKKNVIIRSLGPDSDVEADVEGPHPVEAGDQFLICSDGLSNLVTNQEIGAVLTTFPPEEACKFLIELANLRGGHDNITVVVVAATEDDATDRPENRPKKVGVAARCARWWAAHVPWPISLLGAGVVVALVSIVLKLSEVGGFKELFILSALLIVGGLAGLVVYAKKAAEEDDKPDESAAPKELNIHRNQEFAIDQELFDRMTALEGELKDVTKDKDIGIDWTAHELHNKRATEHAARSAWPEAFKARCLALQVLSGPYNKLRHKPEAFQPNWTKQPT